MSRFKPKNMTYNQKRVVSKAGLEASDWWLDKETPDTLLIVHKETGERRTIEKPQR